MARHKKRAADLGARLRFEDEAGQGLSHHAVVLLTCALVTLTAVLVAGAVSYLARRDHASYPTAITRATVAFTTTLTLTLAAGLVTALANLTRR